MDRRIMCRGGPKQIRVLGTKTMPKKTPNGFLIPKDIAALFGHAPTLKTENDEIYFAMPSDRKIVANQQNSQHSTGPRTALAKKRIRRNALRHGLAAAVVNGPGMSAETNRLAQAICGS